MAAVERNVYDDRTMSILVTGEEGTNEAETFLQDKLCEQGLKGTRDVRRHDDRNTQNLAARGFSCHPPSDASSQLSPFSKPVIEVYAEWAGRCQSVLPLMKRLKLEKDYEPSCFVMLHCKAEAHELLVEFRGKSMPHFLFFRNGVKKATVAGANMPLIEKYIVEYTPFGPDADDLEENPMLKRRRVEQEEAKNALAEGLTV
jgi:thiol-disulfide isomerase/thioredoxin